MKNICHGFADAFPGGVIKIYNAFNLKNQHSGKALFEAEAHSKHPRLFDAMRDVRFLSAPVVFGPGKDAANIRLLREQLDRYIKLVPQEMRYGIQKVGDRQFSAERVNPEGALHAYHPSYSCTRGNKTSFVGLKT